MGRGTTDRLTNALAISGAFIVLLYAVMMADWFTGFRLHQFGIWPRTREGLVGIAFSPLLHGGLGHLIANTVSLFVLLTLLFSDSRYHPRSTLAIVWITSGLGIWLIGRAEGPQGPTVHIGASSIIYGLIAYLMAAGFWMRSWRAGLTAVLVFVFYGGAAVGVLPRDGMISWEGHLCGAIAGVFTAWGHHAK